MFRTIAVLVTVLALAVPAAATAQPDPLAQERYYGSYGEPAPAAAPAPATPADGGEPWRTLAIASGALVLALIGAEIVTLARLRRAT
jgi:hypothetical protein